MEEGWHTYWQFSGDAGAPTQVEWGLPEGWNAGPLQWPLPKKYEEEGDLIVYGYAGRTLLISQVQVPDSAVVGDTVSIMADVSWLVCRELCIPGDARLQISLPVGAGQIQHALLFDRTMETVPAALPPEIGLDYSLSDEGGTRHISYALGAESRILCAWLIFIHWTWRTPSFAATRAPLIGSSSQCIPSPIE